MCVCVRCGGLDSGCAWLVAGTSCVLLLHFVPELAAACCCAAGLQRAMEQQAKLAESLLEESEAMARQHNEQGSAVEALQREAQELRHRLAAQVRCCSLSS